ncbi:MAG: ferritin family protein [Candidatus Aenigmarchaeota archaeon]|nr:ferritin family protein [Candidatus Aenigmarchaeota archaeon]
MNIQESVKMALENELKGKEMYDKFADRAKNNVTKRTFEFLAAEEVKHIEAIRNFDQSVQAKPEGPTSFDEIRSIFEQSIEHFDRQAKPESDDIEAHRLGMDLEQKSHDLYKRLSEEAADENVKRFFVFLMDQENAHFILIQKAYDFISDPEGFYAETEGRVMEG